MIGSFISAGVLAKPVLAGATNYDDGALTGSLMADLLNASYTDTGASATLMSLDSDNLSPQISQSKTIDRMVIRVAFSLRAGVLLMDAHDDMWKERLGVDQIYSHTYGMEWLDMNNDEQLSQFTWDYETNSVQLRGQADRSIAFGGASVNDTDGDIGSNGTLGEDSYQATVDYTNFDGVYESSNVSEVENLDSTYSDLTTDLLETPETEGEWKEDGSDIVVAGVDNVAATIEDVIKSRISIIEGNIPVSRIRLDDYHVDELYQEEVMSSSLADEITEAYHDAKSAGFLSNFKVKSPLKLSRVTKGLKGDAFKNTLNSLGGIAKAGAKTFGNVIGDTAKTTANAFKKAIPSGLKSSIVGVKEKLHTGFKKVGNWFKDAKSNIGNLVKKPFQWFNSLKGKLKWVVLAVVIIGLILLLAFVYVNFIMPMRMSRRMG